MWPFKKKITIDQNAKDEEIVSKLGSKVDLLITMAEDADVIKKLKVLKNHIEYLSVSPKKEIFELDKKIEANIDDIKILISKSKKSEEVFEAIKDVETKIKQRETIY